MKNRVLLIVLLLFLGILLQACPQPQPQPAPYAPSPYIPARAYQVRGEEPRLSYGSYGYVIFTTRPDSVTRSRYQRTCDAFIQNLEDVDGYRDISTPDSLLMVTFWLLEQMPPQPRACSTLLDAYDFSVATRIASLFDKLSSAGPILVAFEQPYQSWRDGDNALILDLSDFSDADMDRALVIWKDQIARDPEIWNDGFNRVKIREAFRNHVISYGAAILTFFGVDTA